MRTVAVIPTRYEPDRLHRLLRVVAPDVDQVLVYDNGHEPPLRSHDNVHVIDARGLGLYPMWNAGWREALALAHPVNVAVLNDDIHVLPGTLRLLAEALRSDTRLGAVYPDRHARLAKGLPPEPRMTALFDPAGSRDMTGYCFMFKGELPLPPFDEGMAWWYGDTIFDENVKLAGFGVAQVDGLPIEHHSDAESNGWARRPELREAAQRDGVRWAQLHDRIENGRWVPA